MDKTVKEIHAKRSVLYQASINNHNKYIDQNTGLFATKFVEKRDCPVCKSASYSNIFSKEGGTYVKCKTCQMIFLNPVFTDEALNNYYKNNHALQSDIVENDQEFYFSIYNKGLN
ncbi:hypothetical protein KSO91_14490, partial [Psychromonas antarctica]|nr:hypothetical protein [Psychromonas antarctica]